MEKVILRIIESCKNQAGEYPDLYTIMLGLPFDTDKKEVRKTLEELVDKGEVVKSGDRYESPPSVDEILLNAELKAAEQKKRTIADKPLMAERTEGAALGEFYPEIQIDPLTERELTDCPYEAYNNNHGGAHKWTNRRWNPDTHLFSDFCPKCRISRSFNSRGYTSIKWYDKSGKKYLTYEHNRKLKGF